MDRYLRQRLLPEIGDAGQEALLAHRAPPMGGAVGAVRDDYLRRAGVTVEGPPPGVAGEAPRATDDPKLEAAAAVLQGAFEAVEEIKRALGVGRPGTLEGFSLLPSPGRGDAP